MDQPPSESIGELLGRLVEDARETAKAEVGLYKAQALNFVGEAKLVGVYGVVALLLVNAAVISLFVGLLLIVQQQLGPIWATIIVVLGTLGVAGLFGWLALRHVRRLTAKGQVK